MLLAFSSAAAASKPAEALQPLLLDVRVNGQRAGDGQLLLRDADSKIYASEASLKLWRLRPPSGRVIEYDGQVFHELAGVNALTTVLSEADQSIEITAAPHLFEQQTADFDDSEVMKMTPAAAGGFLNYDLFAERTSNSKSINGAFELGLFSRFGVGSSTFIGQAGSGRNRLVRLDTQWALDRPTSMVSLRFGDNISAGGPGAPPVRFGGIQYTRNFGVRPGFVTAPVPGISGSAAVPSVIDVYVNNVLQGRREVGAGPFDITGVPLQSGGGSLQLVVRDLLGREIVTMQRYYSSSQMLRRGLHDFSYEFGFLRHDYGTRSNNYGALMASMSHRYGITDGITGEAVLQATRSHQVAGGSVTSTVGKLAMVSSSFTLSNSKRGRGHSLALSVERRVDGLSFGLRNELTSKNFASIGLPIYEETASLTTQVFVDLPFFGGSIGANYLRRDYRGMLQDEALAGVSASINIPKLGFLQLFARHSTVGRNSSDFGAFLVMPLGGGHSSSASVEYGPNQRSATFTMQKDPPAGLGSGYRTSVNFGSVNSVEGLYSLNSSAAALKVQASHRRSNSGVRLSAAGAVGLLGNQLFASRLLGSSFGAVHLGGYSGVRIYADNQLIGTTDKSGTLIIPWLRAFERNTIRLDEADLPLDVQIPVTEMAVRPFGRTGTIIEFAPQRERGALLRVVLEDGKSLPAGSLVAAEGQRQEYTSASGGVVYVPNLTGRVNLKALYGTESCLIDVTVPDDGDPQPFIDDLVCRKAPSYAER